LVSPTGAGGSTLQALLPSLFYYAFAALVVVGAITLFALLRFSRRPKDDNLTRFHPQGPWGKALGLIIIGAVLLSAALALRLIRNNPNAERPTQAARTKHQLHASSRDQASKLEPKVSPVPGAIATTALLLLLVTLIGGALWLRRRPASAVTDSPSRRELAARVDASLIDLEQIADPRAAVIACYARMQNTFESAGVERYSSDTALELLARAFQKAGIPQQSAILLTELFHSAKFSRHPVGEQSRGSAIAALQVIRRRLEVAA
ncbi:MAG: DUF4129 domain-containing protein, partial [Actinomycetota bacterium]|nr:DUF4129 domain-containing protein [Actinomycetota bacterium]